MVFHAVRLRWAISKGGVNVIKITSDKGTFGPYQTVETLADRYRVNGSAELPFVVIGESQIGEWTQADSEALQAAQAAAQAAEIAAQSDGSENL